MKPPKEMIEAYQAIKYPGSLTDMAKAVKFKSYTHMSNVILGKAETTPSKIAAIAKFINKKRQEIASLTSDNN